MNTTERLQQIRERLALIADWPPNGEAPASHEKKVQIATHRLVSEDVPWLLGFIQEARIEHFQPKPCEGCGKVNWHTSTCPSGKD